MFKNIVFLILGLPSFDLKTIIVVSLGVSSRILGALALLGLLQTSFTWEISVILEPLFLAYEAVSAVFSAFILAAVINLNDLVYIYKNIETVINQISGHVYFLLTFYIFREAMLSLSMITDRTNKYRVKLTLTGLANLFFGFFAAIFVLWGTIIITVYHPDSQLILAAISVVVASQVYYLLGSIWDATVLRDYYSYRDGIPKITWLKFIKGSVRTFIWRLFFGSIFVTFFSAVINIFDVPNPAVISVATLIFLFGIYWIDRAIKESKKDSQADMAPKFIKNVHAKLGGAILGIYAWGGAILLLNALFLLIGVRAI